VPDTTAPTIGAISMNQSLIYSNGCAPWQITISAPITDDQSGVGGATLTLRSALGQTKAFAMHVIEASVWGATVDGSTLGNGTWAPSITAADKAGNEATRRGTGSFNVESCLK
jgi:hypothetical protein